MSSADSPSTLHRKVHVIFDFDSTLTAHDTLSTVASIGYAFHTARPAEPSIPPPPPFEAISVAYLADLRTHTKAYAPAVGERTAPEQESAWLASLRDVEAASFERMHATGVFGGLDVRRMSEAGGRSRVTLRKGWWCAFEAVDGAGSDREAGGADIGIVSVNWSAAFIRGVVVGAVRDSAAFGCDGPDIAIESLVERMPILSNEIAAGPAPQESGRTSVYTSADKLECFSSLTAASTRSATVYVGDSATDFNCLLQADYGICVRDSSGAVENLPSGQRELASTFARVGVIVQPLAELLASVSSTVTTPAGVRSDTERAVWWTDDLADVGKLVTLLRSN